MAPPQLTLKWCRETLLTLPRVRVFLIDGVRNGVGSNGHTGVNEVRLRNGRIVREGLQTTLSDLRLRKQFKSARARWQSLCDCPAVFVLSREIAKLSYFWRHAYGVPRSGPFNGSIVNPDTGRPVLTDDDQLRRADFRKTKHSELVLGEEQSNPLKARRTIFSALWQADATKVRRCAPMDLIGRHMKGFFDYGIADEVHELKGETAQGAALGTIASCAKRTIILTGTLNGGYADELVQYPLSAQPEEDARRRICARRSRCAGILGNLWGSRESHNHQSSRQRLFGQSEGNYKSTAAPWRFTFALRPVSDGARRLRVARRHLGCTAFVRRGSDQRRDGSGSGCCLQEPRRGHQGSARRTSRQLSPSSALV